MHCLGVDCHQRHSHVAVVDERGKLIGKGRIGNRPEDAAALFANLEGESRAEIEAARNWLAMHDLLERFAEVALANPLKVKAIASAKIKTGGVGEAIADVGFPSAARAARLSPGEGNDARQRPRVDGKEKNPGRPDGAYSGGRNSTKGASSPFTADDSQAGRRLGGRVRR